MEHIDAAAVELVRIGIDRPLRRIVNQLNQRRLDRNDDARPAALRIEPPARGEHRIAQLFRAQPAARETPKQFVFRVLLHGVARRLGDVILLIGAAEQDQPVQRLHPESALDKLIGQPVEQFRMAGTASHPAEIVGGRDNTGSEVILPDPIHHHSRSQGIRAVRNPLRECESRRRNLVAPFRRVIRQQNTDRPHADLLTGLGRIAACQHVDGDVFPGTIFDGLQNRKRWRKFGFFFRDLLFQALVVGRRERLELGTQTLEFRFDCGGLFLPLGLLFGG